MPYVHETLAKQKALAEAPTLGNLHPDARAQAIARAGIAEAEAMRKRMDFLHSAASVDADGYEWGVFRVKWENGRAVDVQRARADHSDLDATIAAVTRAADDESPHLMSALNTGKDGVSRPDHQTESQHPPMKDSPP